LNILAIETTGKYASVCLLKDDVLLDLKTNENEMEHLAMLLPMAEELLAENKLQIDDITALAVSVGPGSFTGMRIGIAFVRCIAQAKSIKCIAVNTLEAFTRSEGFETSGAKLCMPMLDARRGQVYAALYEKTGEAVFKEAVGTDVYMLQEYLDKAGQFICENCENGTEIFFTGNACIKYEKELLKWLESISQLNDRTVIASFESGDRVETSAENIAKRARKMYAEGKFTDYKELLPNYLRKSEAERKLDDEKLKQLTSASEIINVKG
jgi:universal bacterial protein yeaZ